MTRRERLLLNPDYAIPPGATLRESLAALGMSQAELAQRTGRPVKTISEIISGKAAITADTATQLERVLGVPASVWLSLEADYQATLSRLNEDAELAGEVGWLDTFPTGTMVEYRWIRRRESKVDQVRELLDFFGVASVDAWRQVWVSPQVKFRKSRAFESGLGVTAAWVRKGELEARTVPCQPFDSKAFRAALLDSRALTVAPPEEFVPELQRRCAQAGVAVVFVRELPGGRISGVTQWLTPQKAMIELSLRYRTDDHLWFTFYHEAGHVLLHGKKDTYMELDDAKLDVDSEADQFASRTLVPDDAFSTFVSKHGRLSHSAVAEFAHSIGIAPGIVVGRLQHEQLIPFSHLNGLKRRLAWAD